MTPQIQQEHLFRPEQLRLLQQRSGAETFAIVHVGVCLLRASPTCLTGLSRITVYVRAH